MSEKLFNFLKIFSCTSQSLIHGIIKQKKQHQLHRCKRPASKTIYSISTLYLPAKLLIHAENCRPIRSNQSSSNWLVIVMPSHNYLLCTVPCYPYLLLLVNTIVFIK